MERIPVAVVGASGYTGAELTRILYGHPRVRLAALYAGRHAGERVADDFPQFAGRLSQRYEPYTPEAVARVAQAAFLALPHGESVSCARELRQRGLTVVDLSADFRLRDPESYRAWYGTHAAPELLSQAVYGLVERHRAELPSAKLIAVPGCYPTCALLALLPLIDAGLISADGLIVDAKSGVTGAGRSPLAHTHFSEVFGGIRAYKVAEHRHTPEIEQELSRAAGRAIKVTFTPHLVPMSRGILATCYAQPVSPGLPTSAYLEALRAAYADEPFVALVERPPDSAHVLGSNRVHVSAVADSRAGRVIVMGAIDNLVKGAAGQAVQCLNVAMGWPETEGLEALPVFP